MGIGLHWGTSNIHSTTVLFLPPVTDEDTVKRYYAKFEERFFQTCEKELLKINTFYSGTQPFLSLVAGPREYEGRVKYKTVSDCMQ